MMQIAPVLREFGPVTGAVPAPRPRQVEAMTEEAYARGLADGMARAQAQVEARTAAALEDLAARLAACATERDRAVAGISEEAGKALAAVVRGLCPGLAALGLADRTRFLLENELRAAPRPLTVRAAPEIAETLGTAGSLGADVVVESDEALPPTRLDLAWDEGGATVDTGALVSDILALADTLGPQNDPVEENPHD